MVRDFRLQLNISHKYWLVFVFFVFAVANAKAVTPSAEQLEQFNQLPRDQQERIARQMGLDVSQVGTRSSSTVTPYFVEPVGDGERVQATDYKASISSNATIPDTTSTESRTLAKALKPYGYDLFQSNGQAFMPSVDVPVPDGYIIGPGDSIVVQLYGKENDSHNFTVSREGIVHFPKIGPVNLAGLTFVQVQEMINKTVQEQMIGVKSSVTMGAIRSIRIFVLGEAARPGSYVVSSLSTMTNALFSSGGITSIGSLRNVQLKRQGKIISTLDLYDLLLKGDTSNDARLLSGDVIFIPPIGTSVSVDGEVKRPAIYELKSEKSAGDLIQLAGGLLPTAYPAGSIIQRIDEMAARTVIDIDLSHKIGADTRVNAADILVVPSVLDTLENVVLVEGHVKRPGFASWTNGMRVSDVLVSIDNLLPAPDLRVGLIEREVMPTRKKKILLFELESALVRPGSVDDLVLEPRDTVRVFNYTSDRSEILSGLVALIRNQEDRLREEPLAKVSGNVRFPGVYPISEEMSVLDLINLAGGLTNKAYSLNAEITRYTLDDMQRQVVSNISVSLSHADKQLIQRRDNLNIKRLPDWTEERSVTLEGEVVFPGAYTIQQGETLTELVERAGGLTDQAYPAGAVFTRQALKELEAERIEQLQKQLEKDIVTSSIEDQNKSIKAESDDTKALVSIISRIKPLGRLVIDLPLMLKDPIAQDLILEHGDSVFIPRFKQSVTVVGEVQFPTSHFYDQKLGVDAYISMSGGVNIKADKKRIYIVRANGRVVLPSSSSWFNRVQGEIAPGDTVVVPLDSDRIKSLSLWTNVSQIFYQIALGAAAVGSL